MYIYEWLLDLRVLLQNPTPVQNFNNQNNFNKVCIAVLQESRSIR